MSRYELPGKQPDTLVAIGWDDPLYFLQVYVGSRGCPSVLGKFSDLDDLRAFAEPHVELTNQQLRHLRADRAEGR